MDKFNQFKSIMNSRKKQYSDELLIAAWLDWHCQSYGLKKHYEQLGMTRHDRAMIVNAMDELGIIEQVPLMSFIKERQELQSFNGLNLNMFAEMQNQIATAKEYRR